MKLYDLLLKKGTEDMRRTLFNIVAVGGIIGGFFSLFVSAGIQISYIQIIAICVSEALLFISFWAANWKNKLNIGSFLIIGVITMVLFPIMCITGGGLYGGMSLWFAIGIIFNFLLVDGKAVWVTLAMQTVAILACYWYTYTFPERVIMLASEKAVYIDTIQSLFVISVAVGVIVRFQKKVYMNKLKELEEANIALEEAEHKANEASKAKSDFLANMSHEIRTPVNAIIGMNEMILRETKDANLTEYASVVENSANTLLSIINDILDISGIESGKIDLREESYETISMIQDCYSFVVERANKKGIKIDVHVDSKLPRHLLGDMLRVRQIFVNFLTNAVKYSDKGVVTFSLNCIEAEEAGCIVLQAIVKDEGIGIKPEDLECLFEKFERFDMQHNRNIEGTGLGLNITKMLVDKMHGNIQVASTYGEGSAFTVNIPQKVADENEIGEVSFEDIACIKPIHTDYKQLFTAESAKILVVDDVNINLMVFRKLVKDTKMQVETANNGMEAVEMAKKTEYDLIFMDHMMPQMGGVETFECIQKDGRNMKTPVIMLTANAIAGMEEMFRKKGFIDYMTKPIDSRILEQMLMKYLPKEKVELNEHAAMNEEVQENEKMITGGEEKQYNIEHIKNIQGLDFEYAMNNCMGDEKVYIEILKDYCLPAHREKLQEMYDKKDYDTYRVMVHALKSDSKTVGLAELSKMAEEQEMALKNKDMDYVMKHHGLLMESYQKVVCLVTSSLTT